MPKQNLRQLLAEEGLAKQASYRLTSKDRRIADQVMDLLSQSDAGLSVEMLDVHGRWAPMVEDILLSMGDTGQAEVGRRAGQRLKAILAAEGLTRTAGQYNPVKAWADDIKSSGRYRIDIQKAVPLPGASARATDEVWEDGAPVAKRFSRSRKRPIPAGTYEGIWVNDGTVYVFDGRWWYQALDSDFEQD